MVNNPISKSTNSTTSPRSCEKYSNLTSQEWEKEFLRETKPGTWHVFVASLGKGADHAEAVRVAQVLNRRFPNHKFQTMATFSGIGNENFRYAVVIAEGLTSETTARKIARYADKCGIAKGAYPYRQPL